MKPPPTPPAGPPGPGDDDPEDRIARLTALALGELSQAEAGALEAAIWRDTEARLEVAKIRELAEQLTFAYAAEPPISLTPDQQRAILERNSQLTGTDEKQERLTAYALGELRPSQAEVLSARLIEDRAATLELEAVGALAARLRAAFAEENVPLLTLAQRQAILDHRPIALDATVSSQSPATRRPARETLSGLRPHQPNAGPRPAHPGSAPRPAHPGSTPRPAHPGSAPRPAHPGSAPRPRRWLQTAAIAAGFAAVGHLASTHNRNQQPSVSALPSEVSSTRSESFFPPIPPAANPGSPQLAALLDREKRRPSAQAALGTPSESGASVASIEPGWSGKPSASGGNSPSSVNPADTSEAAALAPAEVAEGMSPAVRRQPDASVLPPARKAVAAAPGTDTVLHTPITGSEPLTGFLASTDVAIANLPTDLGRAGYDIVRQCIRDFGTLPPASLVRPEEIINQFDYDVQPAPGQDFAVAVDAADCPWNESHQLVRVTVAARSDETATPPLRLTVFLRLSDSPESERAQLLAWQGLQALAGRLRPADSVSLVVWGRARGLVLPATGVADVESLREAPTRWHQGGPVHGSNDWITVEQALFHQAADNARNVCLVVTDGPLDFSGLTLDQAAQRLRPYGFEIAVAELGPLSPHSRTVQDADFATTPFFRADSGPEAVRLLAQEIFTSRAPVAEDVRVQVAFNPSALAAWRPIGFTAAGRPAGGEARAAWTAGRQLTALYEVVPAAWPQAAVFASPALPGTAAAPVLKAAPPLSVRLNYRVPRSTTTHSLTTDWTSSAAAWRTASPDFRLAAGAAAFALRLQNDHAVRDLPLDRISRWVRTAAETRDPHGLRREFAGMLEAAGQIKPAP
jgi:Ca-activated chloride channel family protein